MTLSMYDAAIPAFIHMLNNLSAILDKAAKHAEAKKIDLAVLVNARLAPDMFPLSRQIQIASDIVKNGSARLAGVEIPSFPDEEKTFPELQARIKKTIDFLQSIKPEQFKDSETRDISFKMGGRDAKFVGQPYLFTFVIPNFYFHITTAYAILRHNGVELGKGDFLGG